MAQVLSGIEPEPAFDRRHLGPVDVCATPTFRSRRQPPSDLFFLPGLPHALDTMRVIRTLTRPIPTLEWCSFTLSCWSTAATLGHYDEKLDEVGES